MPNAFSIGADARANFPAPPSVLAALGADLGALRPAAEIDAALRTFTLPPLIDPDALAASTVREKRRLGFVGRVSPTDPLLRTGAMRSSIRGEGDAMVATVRANAPAKWQEQGTSNGHVPARPFIGPALKDAAPEALRLLAETFETAIRES